MEEDASDTVTRLLRKVSAEDLSGTGAASDLLYENIYDDLRRRARRQRRRWKGEPTLQTTALVHEAYLKLVQGKERSWESRSHFFAVAAKAMRHILIDRARRKRAQKRGGRAKDLSLEKLRETLGREVAMSEEDAEAFVLLEEALSQLEENHPRAARVVECRFFSGMTIEESAEALGVSTATVSRDWKQAKSWLYREMKRIRGDDAGADSSSGKLES